MGYLGLPGIRLGGEAKRGFGIDASAKNKFGRKGATNREDTLTGTISATVTEGAPKRRLADRRATRSHGQFRTADHDDRRHRSTGGCEYEEHGAIQRDRRRQNRILRLGVVDDVQRPGWFVRILDWVIHSNRRIRGKSIGSDRSHHVDATQTTTSDDHAMFSSDDVQRRAANTGSGSEQLTRSWLSPQPQTTPAPAPHPSVSPWLRRTVVGMIAFLTLSLSASRWPMPCG